MRLTDRYLPDQFLPDKAIDAMDEAGSLVRIKAGAKRELSMLKTSLPWCPK